LPPIAAVVGTVLGLVPSTVNFHGITAILTRFAKAQNTPSMVSHIAFDRVLDLSYRVLAK